ncbi:MAG TPA: RsmG family class I SAM-dependent methyltransferase [Actinomycetota bacterium]|nr:RsmG family class I SAM-dependent methyltransferase [Actinomycetota bacterium]
MPSEPSPRRIAAAAAALGVPLERSAADRLAALAALLEEVAVPRGFISASDAGGVLERHVLDSLRATSQVRRYDRLAYDLGSGAGLPGLVLAIAAPRCRVVLVESKARRAGFLEMAVDRLNIANADVALARAEDVATPADVATARAFAPLPRSWKVAFPLLRPGGRLVYFAGEALGDPGAAAAALSDPEPPASVELARGLATRAPLVIMTRG